MRIQIDFDAVGAAAAALATVAVTPLPDATATGRPSVDGALDDVRQDWTADPLPTDVDEVRTRLTSASTDFASTEESIAADLRSIGAALG